MKIRTGFVSNSSSSSFVVLLPDNYKLPEITEKMCKWTDSDPNEIRKKILEGISDGKIHEYDDAEVFEIASELFDKYELCSFDIGADGDSVMAIYTKEVIEEILRRYK